MDLSSFTSVFFEEADEHLANMEALLLGLDIDQPDVEALNAIFRSAHSVKGGAATFGFEKLQRTTHIFENLLDDLRKGEMTLRTDIVETFLETKDVLTSQLDAYKQNVEPDDDTFKQACEKLQAIANESGAEPVAITPKPSPAVEATASDVQKLKISLKGVKPEDLVSLKEELGHFGKISATAESEGACDITMDSHTDKADIEAVLLFIIDQDQLSITELSPEPQEQPAEPVPVPVAKPAITKAPASRPAASPASTSSESSTLRVPVEKVDQIINLVGELVITQSMLDQSVNQLDGQHSELANGMSLLQRNARDLQEAVMSIRMVQMDFVFSRFPRQIRDLAGKLNKEVELVTIGKSTELDKSLVERIIDPLSHLVRNSLDHGIESPEKRIAAGKPRTGTLTLSAQHQGGNIVIEVIDDGAGLNREKLLEKARGNGLVAPDSMTDDEVWQLIFAPGFSTAEVVTDISGRGVGMDVVKRNIQSLGGQVQILSRQGEGTTTRIVLPLTMAILDGMSICSGREIFILPLGTVVESLQPKLENVYPMAGNDKLLKVRDEYLPLVVLKDLLHIDGAKDTITDCIAVIVQAEGRRYALVIDELIGQQQVVVKNLETNYKKIPGFSAATILGDGSVSLILDVAELFKL
ncbi:chemotaxis protein CheA [Pseudomonas putida]|uniref:Chemotaxis protein CheA n=1 Tax=Pseudomonas putida TaxID=303 RepID=A0A8I1EAF6_PSEPU|nr:chemotaxis protein CheA [Pseudomonas putida]MBI6882824.1 chemotaxis protein CheA [Pseudomonas putida]